MRVEGGLSAPPDVASETSKYKSNRAWSPRFAAIMRDRYHRACGEKQETAEVRKKRLGQQAGLAIRGFTAETRSRGENKTLLPINPDGSDSERQNGITADLSGLAPGGNPFLQSKTQALIQKSD